MSCFGTPPGNRTLSHGFWRPRPAPAGAVHGRRAPSPAARVVPPGGLEPPSATFATSCSIRGTGAGVRGRLTAGVRVAGEAPPRAVAGSRRRWRPHRRGQARRPLTRAGHLRGGAPGASLTRSPECRYLRPVVVTVTDVYRPERSASPPTIVRLGGIEPSISGLRDRGTDHCPTSAENFAVSEGGPAGGMTPAGEGLATNLPVVQRARRDSNPHPTG